MSPRSESFCAEALPYVEAVYSDALCLTGRHEDAADLVVGAYLRAFREYRRERRGQLPPYLEAHGTLAWLYWNMHALFCEHALAGRFVVPRHKGNKR